jgi:hypothetical protein
MGYWRDDGARLAQGMAAPVGAKQLNDAVTSDSPYGKHRSVSINFTFRANVELTYSCGGFASVLSLSPAPNLPMNSFPNSAHSGDTFSCVLPVTFQKIDEGWAARIIQSDPNSYIIRR